MLLIGILAGYAVGGVCSSVPALGGERAGTWVLLYGVEVRANSLRGTARSSRQESSPRHSEEQRWWSICTVVDVPRDGRRGRAHGRRRARRRDVRRHARAGASPSPSPSPSPRAPCCSVLSPRAPCCSVLFCHRACPVVGGGGSRSNSGQQRGRSKELRCTVARQAVELARTRAREH